MPVVAQAQRPPGDRSQATNWLQVATQAFGLFAGIGALIYATGAIVLSARFALANIPGDPVVSHLPRDFVLSTGAGQVVIPSLAVGAIYGLFRLLRGDRSEPRAIWRWRDKAERANAVGLYGFTFSAMLIPVGYTLIFRDANGGFGFDPLGVFTAYGLLVVAAVAWQEGRAAASRYLIGRAEWNRLRGAAAMAGVWALGAIPAMTFGAAAIPLNEAKLCSTGDFEERGVLLGQSGESIYLAENRPDNRRLAIFPASESQELFVGSEAMRAKCEFEVARFAVIAAKGDDALSGARAALDRSVRAALATGGGAAMAGAMSASVEAAQRSIESMHGVLDAAIGAHALGGHSPLDGIDAVSWRASGLEARLAAFEAAGDRSSPRAMAAIRRGLRRLAGAVDRVAGSVHAAAGWVLAEAERRQDG